MIHRVPIYNSHLVEFVRFDIRDPFLKVGSRNQRTFVARGYRKVRLAAAVQPINCRSLTGSRASASQRLQTLRVRC